MDYKAIGVQTGEMVVRILKGEKAGDIAFETSNKLSLHVNPGAAQKQGVTLAEDLVKDAAKVIE
jgi:putative ABC transport system substrate-binding protein